MLIWNEGWFHKISTDRFNLFVHLFPFQIILRTFRFGRFLGSWDKSTASKKAGFLRKFWGGCSSSLTILSDSYNMLPQSPPLISRYPFPSRFIIIPSVPVGFIALYMMSLWSRVNSPCWCSLVHFESIVILLESIHRLSWWQTSAIDKVVTLGTLCVRTWTEFKLRVGVFTMTWMACGFAAPQSIPRALNMPLSARRRFYSCNMRLFL